MVVEFPGVFVASYLGDFTRKYVLMGIMIIGGLSCIISSFLSAGDMKMWLAILGKMSISGSFSLVYVYAAEMFPTILRITGLGMCSFCARFGAMTAPYLLQLVLSIYIRTIYSIYSNDFSSSFFRYSIYLAIHFHF
mgnify:CR=1 FL=1